MPTFFRKKTSPCFSSQSSTWQRERYSFIVFRVLLPTCLTSSWKSLSARRWCSLIFLVCHLLSSCRWWARISWITESTWLAPSWKFTVALKGHDLIDFEGKRLCIYVLSTNMICLMDGNTVVRNIGKWPGSPLQGPSTWEAVWAPDKECVNTLCLKIQSWQNCFKNWNLTTCQHQHHLSRNLKHSRHQRYLSQSWMPSS